MDKKDFLKLKQNSRIEYLLRLGRIEERYKSYPLLDNFVFFTFLLAMILVQISLTTEYNFFNTISTILMMIIIYVVIIFILNVIYFLIENKKEKELESEFLKVEVKAR